MHMASTTKEMTVSDEAYRRLLQLRFRLRQFIRWSEGQARAAGLHPMQHQLLLAVRGHEDPRGPVIGDVAHYLVLRHHSAVELVNRAEAAGLIERRRDSDDHRSVRLALTAAGHAALQHLSALHLEELRRLAPALAKVWQDL
jgi:DNA-binding MarR family transcriptional regulator